MHEAILFRRCLGLNDSTGIASQTMITNPRAKGAGSAELIDCLNLSTTPDGCIEKLPALVTALDTGAVISSLSAGTRLMFSDGASTREWTGGSTIVNRFPGMTGPVCHTPLDVRVSSIGGVYKSINSSPILQPALVGNYTGPTVRTPFMAMPRFNQAFVYNSNLLAINAEDPQWLQYSWDYGYDLWPLGDNHLKPGTIILQAGQIPGVVVMAHAVGVTVSVGSNVHELGKKFYPCTFINNTLCSGKINQTAGASDGTPVTTAVQKHVFLCGDGVYTVDQDGTLTNITDPRSAHLGTLNNSYSCAVVQGDKYLAFGDRCCVEYDFQTKSLMKRETFGIVGACSWYKTGYFATGNRIVTQGGESDTSSDFECGLTLPYSDLSASGVKSIEALYFTGTLGGDLTITATDQNGESWEWVETAAPGKATNFRIKTPKRKLGNHISFQLWCNGAFRLEELRATIAGSKRSR